MFQFSVLASGSKGNCSVIRTDNTKILLDAGLSGKKIYQAIKKVNLKKEKIDALIVSHEHSDHVRGAGIVCRKLKIPLYITKDTYFSVERKLGKLPMGLNFFNSNSKFLINDIEIEAFNSSHDAIDSCNFIFKQKQQYDFKLGFITDLGYPSRLTLMKLKDVTSLVLESNHDEEMLLQGPYPWELKQRVRSKHGHLSNKQAKELLTKIDISKLKNIVLAHLSEENNKPELAMKSIDCFLKDKKLDINVLIASQRNSTPLIDI